MPALSKLLVPVDDSELGARALGMCNRVLPWARERRVLHVLTEKERQAAHGDEQAAIAAQRERLAALVAEYGVERDEIVVRTGADPARVILSEIASWQPEVVGLVTHGRGGLRRWVMGSVATKLLRHCPVPLLIGHPGGGLEPERVERILVPVDGPDGAPQIIPVARSLARKHDAELILFEAGWIEPIFNPLREGEREARERQRLADELEPVLEQLRGEGLRVRSHIVLDHADLGILRAIETDRADLVVMTVHGYSGLKRWLLGSVAERVARLSPVPVLLVREDGVTAG